MIAPLRLCIAAICASLAGCIGQAEKEYRERQNQHFRDKDVVTKMEQRAAAQFPEELAQMRAVFDGSTALVTPKLISTVKPKYPPGKARKGVQAGVWVVFVVKEDGAVRDARAVTDEDMPADPVLAEAAVTAVRQWKFSPAKAGDRRIEYLLCVPVLFELRDGI